MVWWPLWYSSTFITYRKNTEHDHIIRRQYGAKQKLRSDWPSSLGEIWQGYQSNAGMGGQWGPVSCSQRSSKYIWVHYITIRGKHCLRLVNNTPAETIVTPHVSDIMGVIVLTSSLCVSVCASVSLSWANGQTYGLEFWHGGQVEGYLGQGQRSRSWSQKMFNGAFHWLLKVLNLSMDLPKKKLSYKTWHYKLYSDLFVTLLSHSVSYFDLFLHLYAIIATIYKS